MFFFIYVYGQLSAIKNLLYIFCASVTGLILGRIPASTSLLIFPRLHFSKSPPFPPPRSNTVISVLSDNSECIRPIMSSTIRNSSSKIPAQY